VGCFPPHRCWNFPSAADGSEVQSDLHKLEALSERPTPRRKRCQFLHQRDARVGLARERDRPWTIMRVACTYCSFPSRYPQLFAFTVSDHRRFWLRFRISLSQRDLRYRNIIMQMIIWKIPTATCWHHRCFALLLTFWGSVPFRHLATSFDRIHVISNHVSLTNKMLRSQRLELDTKAVQISFSNETRCNTFHNFQEPDYQTSVSILIQGENRPISTLTYGSPSHLASNQAFFYPLQDPKVSPRRLLSVLSQLSRSNQAVTRRG
jgi:hypothetical protein